MAETVTGPVVRVEHLSKRFGSGTTRVDALVDINMEVYPGEVVGLMGPSGSGKTTLLNCIACILEPSSGRLTLDGEVVYDDRWLRADLRRLRLEKVGFIFQYPNLLPFLDGSDNVAVVLELAGFAPAAARARAVELLNYLEVGHRKHASPARGDCPRARQPAPDHPGRRADRTARFAASPNRHGPAPQGRGR